MKRLSSWKASVQPLMTASLWSAAILSVFFIQPDTAVIDHPLCGMQLSWTERILMLSYSFILLFCVLVLSLCLLWRLCRFFAVCRALEAAPLRHFIWLSWMVLLIGAVARAETQVLKGARIWALEGVLLGLASYGIFWWLHTEKNEKAFLASCVGVVCGTAVMFYVAPKLLLFAASTVGQENMVQPIAIFILAAAVITGGVFWIFRSTLLRIFQRMEGREGREFLVFRALYRMGMVFFVAAAAICVSGLFFENFDAVRPRKNIAAKEKTHNSNILLIVIDALRADHVGCYGYARSTTPVLDALAADSVLFQHAYATASWTKPSVASLLTSLYPLTHGAVLHGAALPEEAVTLPELLQQAGYVTYAYIANPNLKNTFQFDQGFVFFDDFFVRDRLYYATIRNIQRFFPVLRRIVSLTDVVWHEQNNAVAAHRRITRWLNAYRDKSFFMYLHYIDPHSPYFPSSGYAELFSATPGSLDSEETDLYDGEIRLTDDYIGKLFQKLRSLGLYDKTMIIVTSDHGEAFGDHGADEHGETLYEEQIKVPLIIKFPFDKHKGCVITARVSLLDVVPTILDRFGLSAAGASFEGISLLPVIAASGKDATASERILFFEENLANECILYGATSDDGWKYIFTAQSTIRNVAELGHEELYDIFEDPAELSNLALLSPEVTAKMRERLDDHRRLCQAKSLPQAPARLFEETIDRLKSLGYL